MFIVEASLPKPTGRGRLSHPANVPKNVSVCLDKLDIESASNSKSMSSSIILEHITNNYGGYLLGIFLWNI